MCTTMFVSTDDTRSPSEPDCAALTYRGRVGTVTEIEWPSAPGLHQGLASIGL